MVDEHELQESIRFHGHMCVGLALGLRASGLALRVLGTDRERNDLIVAVETDTCSVDGIQVLTGCTFGNGKLYFRDHAKSAYTFWQDQRETALRIVVRPEGPNAAGPEFWARFERVQRGSATEEERAAFSQDQRERSQRILASSDDDLFSTQETHDIPPTRPLVSAPVRCGGCGEATMTHRTVERAGAPLCATCGPDRTNLLGSR